MLKIKQILQKVLTTAIVMALVVIYIPTAANAAQITARKVVLGSSVASASTTYALTFTVPTTATIVKSVSFVPCTTASGACTTPSGFSGTGATSSQPSSAGLGDTTGWTTTDSTATELRLSKTGNVATPTGATPVTVTFSTVTNPSATNATFFIRMTTFSTATWTTVLDTGTVATSTAGQITVTASVDETLSFTLGSSTVALGTITNAASGSGVSSMSVSTNAATGYAVTYSGTTLTSGGSTITALSSPTASAINTKQFGINLVANTTPAVGVAASGAGSGVAATGYNTINQFKFLTGDTIASASLPTNSNTYTVSYIANVDGATAAGAYSTLLTYVATANF